MKSAEQSSSHDSLDSTDQVPCPWITDTDVDAPATAPIAIATPEQRRPIPSIVGRDGIAPFAQPAVAKQKSEPRRVEPTPTASAKSQLSSDASAQDLDMRPTIPLWAPKVETASASARAKVEIASALPVASAPVRSRVEPAVATRPALEAAPAPTQAGPAARPIEATPQAAASGPPSAPVAVSTFGAGMLQARKRNVKRGQAPPDTVAHDAAVAPAVASPEPRTFGAGMLDARKVRTKRAAQRGPELGDTLDRDAALDTPHTFGAGMLQARKGGVGRSQEPSDTVDHDAIADAGPGLRTFGAGMLQARKGGATLPPTMGDTFDRAGISGGATSTFGAGVLRARNGRAKLVVAVILAVAITAVCLAMW